MTANKKKECYKSKSPEKTFEYCSTLGIKRLVNDGNDKIIREPVRYGSSRVLP